MPTITRGSKIGLGTIGPSEAIPLLAKQVAAGIDPPGIIGVDDAGIAIDARRLAPEIPTITRYVNQNEDAAQFLSPDPAGRSDRSTASLRVHAQAAIAYCLDGKVHKLSPQERDAMRWLAVLNEPDPPGADGWRALGDYCAVLIDEAGTEGLRLALPGFNNGTPEANELDAFLASGAVEAAEAAGCLWMFHEGVRPGSNDPLAFGPIPGGRHVPDAGPQFCRYRYWLERCRERGLHMRLAVTELYLAGRYDPGQLALTLAQAIAYDDQLRQDPEVIFAAPFTLVGPTGQGWDGANFSYLHQALLEHQTAIRNEPNPTTKTYQVLDISQYQEKPIDSAHGIYQVVIDFDAVRQSGVAAVIIRVGDGLWLDPTFGEHVRRALASGLPWAVFHYFRSRVNAAQQAALVLANVRAYWDGAPPAGVWGDLEEDSPWLRGFALYQAVDTYLNRLDQGFGLLTAGIYSRASYLDEWFQREWQLTWRNRPGWWANNQVPAGWVGLPRPYVLKQRLVPEHVAGVLGLVDVDDTFPDAPFSALVSQSQTDQEVIVAMNEALRQALLQDARAAQTSLTAAQAAITSAITKLAPPPPPPDPTLTPQKHTMALLTAQMVINLFSISFGLSYYDALTRAGLARLIADRGALYAGPAIEDLPLTDPEKAKLIAGLPTA